MKYLRYGKKITNFFRYNMYMLVVMKITSLLPNLKISNKIRGFMLKPIFKGSGQNLQVASGVIINMPRNIEIGNDVYIAHNCWINGSGGLVIEDKVIISPQTIIATTRHEYINGMISNKVSTSMPMKIGKGSWIASNSVLTMGANIGKGTIVAAGTVVTKDLDSFTLYGGVPAKKIKKLEVV